MESQATSADWWTVELEGMPHFEMAMNRIYAWYDSEIVDRVPVRFIAHNADFDVPPQGNQSAEELKKIWFDEEYQVDQFLQSVQGKRFHGETFPIFSPNLGPDVYAAFYGAELEYGEVTSWSHPIPEVHAIQWVQGLGELRPIMQWVPLIQKVQAAGRAIIVDLQPDELEDFMAAVRPEGIYLWVGTEEEEQQQAILRRLEQCEVVLNRQ